MRYAYGHTGLRHLLLAGAALTAFAAGSAQAQTATNVVSKESTGSPAVAPPPPATDIWHRPLLTGNWNGGRTRLKADGITINAFYVGEFADALSGGKRTGNDIASQFGLGADVDLGKLAGLDGAILHVGFNQRVGRSTTADDIGNEMAVQEVYGAGETLRVVEMDYEQKFGGGHFDSRIGFYPMGILYGGTPLLTDFQNTGFCSHPLNLPNSSGWTDYPTGKWGGSLRYIPAANAYIQAGVFDVNPSYSAHDHGLKTSLSGSTGALFPVELEYTSALGPAGLPGHYKLGGYYDTSTVKNAADISTAQTEMTTGRYGVYVLTDQMVLSFDGAPDRGLIAFAQVSYSDPHTAVYESTFDGGFVAQGPFAVRPKDFFAVGYIRAGLNNRTIKAKELSSQGTLDDLTEGEGVVEVGYGLQATPWLLIHPNFQYITDPGTFAYKHIKNALAFGLQTKVAF
jgi:porin